MSADAVWQFLTVLILLILVLAAAYYVTRLIARYQQGQMLSNNIEVIETYRLSTTKYVQIIRLGESYIAIAVCKDTITMLKELTADELTIMKRNGGKEGQGFQEVFGLLKKKEKP